MGVLQPFVPPSNSESPLVCLRGGGFFFSTRRVLLRGDGGLVTKRRHIGRVGLGLWGRGGVDMRHLGAGGVLTHSSRTIVSARGWKMMGFTVYTGRLGVVSPCERNEN